MRKFGISDTRFDLMDFDMSEQFIPWICKPRRSVIGLIPARLISPENGWNPGFRRENHEIKHCPLVTTKALTFSCRTNGEEG